MFLIFLTAIIFWTAHPTFAADYEVTHLEPKRIFKGTTLFADISDREWPRVVEVDFNGNIVWEYRPLESGAILDAAKLKNGNILITIRGSGIYEVTRDGKVVWEHEDPGASHDADRLPNGNTLYNLGWSAKGEDVVREIDPNGKIVWSWKGLVDYDREPFNEIDRGGWMHVNSVSRLSNGNTLVSIRNFNTIAEVGPDGGNGNGRTRRGRRHAGADASGVRGSKSLLDVCGRGLQRSGARGDLYQRRGGAPKKLGCADGILHRGAAHTLAVGYLTLCASGGTGRTGS